MIRSITTSLVLTTSLCVACFTFALDNCPVLPANPTTDALVSFLVQSASRTSEQRDPECITAAIRHLEYQSSPEITTLLIRYLDFQRPLSRDERAGFTSHGPLGIGALYPATSTLMTFGDKIAPDLLKQIKESESPIVRRNSAYVLVELYREEPEKAIGLMRSEASQARGLGVERLMFEARESSQWCGKRHKSACDNARMAPN